MFGWSALARGNRGCSKWRLKNHMFLPRSRRTGITLLQLNIAVIVGYIAYENIDRVLILVFPSVPII